MAIREYNYNKDKDVVLSEHFKVGEFNSNANGKITTPKILIDENLIKLLEKLITKLGATKAVITSGYRDSICDKLVGGTGKGEHVNGRAVDIIFYQGNRIIDTKLVSCYAQDLGFGGIARISDRAIHLDTRTGKRYLGDETKSYNTVTDDFYKYYNIKKNTDADKVKAKFKLQDETMEYLKAYEYADDLFKKLLQ